MRKVLEIGIGSPDAMKHMAGYKPGASLRMWAEYFPDAGIFGLDKDERTLFTDARVQTAVIDQAHPECYGYLLHSVAPFDLIVDDGSHEVEHQASSLKALLPFLRKGGLYIIEDVNQPEELLAKLTVPCSYVRVRGELEGRCVLIYG